MLTLKQVQHYSGPRGSTEHLHHKSIGKKMIVFDLLGYVILANFIASAFMMGVN